MNRNPFEQLRTVLKSVTMTAEERFRVRENITSHMVAPKKSNDFVRSPYALLFSRPLAFTALGLVLLLGSGSTVALAAQNTVPGDTLYNFKVHVVEEIVAATKLSPTSEALYAIERTNKRLDEAAKLAINNSLTPERESVLAQHIATHTQETNTSKTDLNNDEQLSIAGKIASTVTPRTALLAQIDTQRQTDELKNIITITKSTVHDTEKEKENIKKDIQIKKLATSVDVSKKVESVQKQISHLETTESDLAPNQVEAVNELVREAEEKIKEQEYSEALILLQEAEEEATSKLILVDLQKEFNIEVIPTEEETKELSREKITLSITPLDYETHLDDTGSFTGEITLTNQTESTTYVELHYEKRDDVTLVFDPVPLTLQPKEMVTIHVKITAHTDIASNITIPLTWTETQEAEESQREMYTQLSIIPTTTIKTETAEKPE